MMRSRVVLVDLPEDRRRVINCTRFPAEQTARPTTYLSGKGEFNQSARSARRARPLKRTALLAKPVNGINAPQRPDCVAGHVRFEVRRETGKE